MTWRTRLERLEGAMPRVGATPPAFDVQAMLADPELCELACELVALLAGPGGDEPGAKERLRELWELLGMPGEAP